MLQVRNLKVRYGGAVLALRSVSLDVPDGAVVAVLGSNGAGKTTLLRSISGALADFGGAVDEGSIEFEGKSLVGRPAAALAGDGVVLVPEGRRVFTRLTVAENLRAGGFAVKDRARRAAAADRVRELFPLLHERRDQRAGLLSGGQQQMLAIGRALMACPRLLLIDEPSLGLAPRMVGHIGEVIKEINAQGTTVLLIEQNATMALSVATNAVVLTLGEVTLSGTAAALAADESVRDLYLGGPARSADDTEPAAGEAEPPGGEGPEDPAGRDGDAAGGRRRLLERWSA
ncbi:ABC transporter ATP-binding protein [Streptomyces sp. GC420]|uniref:ABC transporter ATP-binding protein n=1 Tax=Streptomyces sp. GC420 TaxID=2697568 RepID=UPI0014150EFE|nr:ABC transporter ATP-binding protein [Streptomyces sp. GC420]NBM18564.1 ATP-binding cassette domain-containing protein [Streptomyces sp. GC420]